MKRALFRAIFIPGVLLFIAGCDHDDGIRPEASSINLRGQAYFPQQLTSGKVAVAGAAYQVLDFQKAPTKQLVAEGVTDANGTYDVEITQSKIVAVIVTGPVRVSGLISADASQIDKDGLIGKDFDGVTDIGCEAGVTAILDGAVSPDDYDDERIANLEAGAAVVDVGGAVDHLDPASVSAAALQVRQITDNGDHPPS